jgi:hypothetical protein
VASVRDELLSGGEFGEAAVDLLYTLTAQELRKVLYLAGSERWSGVGSADAAHEYFVAKGARVTRRLITEAPDDAAVGRILRSSIRRWLIDQSRKTALGARYRRLETVLRAEAELFERVPDGEPGAGRWRLRGGNGPSEVDFRDLVAAAWSVTDVEVPAWTDDRRRAPFASSESLARVVDAVLRAARGSVTVTSLVSVCSDRFPLGLDPYINSSSELEETPSGDDTVDQVVASEVAADVDRRGQAIFAELTPDERRLLPVLGESVEERRVALDLGRSQTQLRTRRLRTRLAALIGSDPDHLRLRDEVLLRVADLCRQQDVAVSADDSTAVPSDLGGTGGMIRGGCDPGEW